MKKVFGLLLVCVILVTGCTKKTDSGNGTVVKKGNTVSDVLEQKMQESATGTPTPKPTDKQGNTKQENTPAAVKSEFTGAIDVDLTQMSSTVVYSEVYNMMYTPADYRGKAVKMNGQFNVFIDDLTGNIYYLCLIADATACCQQGMEFVLRGDYQYPQDYPEIGSEVTVAGIFQTYYEGSKLYCHLEDAVFQ